MKEQYTSMRTALLVLFSLFFLQACGGSSDKQPTYSITSTTSNVAFNNEFLQNENLSATIKVNFDGTGLLVGFAPDATPVPWLNYRIENLTATSATIHLDVTNAQQMLANLYGTTLRLTSGDPATTNFAHHDIDVSLLIWQALSFDDTFGVSDIASQTVAISSSTDNLTLTASEPWLTLSKSFADGITTITATPDLTNIAASGLYQANINITSPLGTTQHPVELSLDNIHIFAERATVAMAKTANINNQQAVLKILSNSLLPWTWQASTDASWLTITMDSENNLLQLIADSSSLADKQTTTAEISLQAGENTTAVASTIKVSLYKDSDATEQQTLAITANDNAIVVDPLYPYYYVATANELRRYHLYSNELLNSLTIAPEESLLEQLIIHPSANIMLAKADEILTVDETTTETVTHRYKINLTDFSVTDIEQATINNEPVKYIALDGRYFIVTQGLEYANSDLVRIGNTDNAFFSSAFNVATDSQALFALDVNNTTLKRFTAKVNDFGSNPITTTETHSYHPELLAETDRISDFFVSKDEGNIFMTSANASGGNGLSEWLSFDGEIFTDNGLLQTDDSIVNLALAASNNDRAHYVRFDPSAGFKIDVYDQQALLTNSIALANDQPSQLLLSADNSRGVLHSSRENSINIVNLSQFTSATDTLTINTNFGDATVAQQQIALSGIGENWTATASVPWLQLTQLSAEDGEQLLVDIDTSLITGWGLMTASINIYDPASGTSRVITVELAIDAIRLNSNYPALAFNHAPSQQTLSHTVNIRTNSEKTIAWQATSSAAWLSLTKTGSSLTITANEAALGAGLHYAEIQLSAVNSAEALPATIQVSFQKTAADADNVDLTDITINNAGIVLDPMRPHMYIASGDTINTYHVLTGALVNSSRSPLVDVDLTNLVVHPDGSMLLASNSETYLDEDEQEQTRVNHYQFNLANYQFIQIDSANIDIEFRPIMIKMVAGAAVVITQTLEYADLNLTRHFWDQENAYFTSAVAQANNLDTVMAFKSSSTSLERYNITYNAFAAEKISATTQPAYTNGAFSAVSSFALSNNGNTIYTANNISEWASFSGSDYSDQGVLFSGNNIQSFTTTTDSSDNSFFYRFDPSQGVTLTKYNKNQVQLWSEVVSGGTAQSHLLPDYQRVIIIDSANSAIRLRSHQ